MAPFEQVDTTREQRLRGSVLKMIYLNHRRQRPHLDHVMLCAVLRETGHSVGVNDVITVLQDLQDRGYLLFREMRNDYTNDIEISRIGITPAGRDVMERTKTDPAVLLY